jgi:small GTP-binding protein
VPDREASYTFKLVFLGDTGVGKTSLVQRYVYNSLSPDLVHTIGAALHVKRVEYQGEINKLVVWDLGGQESFAALREQYCSNAAGAFFVIDRTRPETFENIDNWLTSLYNAAGKVPVILVENKIDLDPAISQEEIHAKAAERVLKVVSTSATEDKNVDIAFAQLVGEIHRFHGRD